jgi:hypothetical protein
VRRDRTTRRKNLLQIDIDLLRKCIFDMGVIATHEVRIAVKVRVERIRRGRRTAEVDYVHAELPARRRPARQAQEGDPVRDPWENDREVSTRLRLPWQRESHRNNNDRD